MENLNIMYFYIIYKMILYNINNIISIKLNCNKIPTILIIMNKFKIHNIL